MVRIHIYTAPSLLKLGKQIFAPSALTQKVIVYIKNAEWKSAMEEKFKEYDNVVVKVFE